MLLSLSFSDRPVFWRSSQSSTRSSSKPTSTLVATLCPTLSPSSGACGTFASCLGSFRPLRSSSRIGSAAYLHGSPSRRQDCSTTLATTLSRRSSSTTRSCDARTARSCVSSLGENLRTFADAFFVEPRRDPRRAGSSRPAASGEHPNSLHSPGRLPHRGASPRISSRGSWTARDDSDVLPRRGNQQQHDVQHPLFYRRSGAFVQQHGLQRRQN